MFKYLAIACIIGAVAAAPSAGGYGFNYAVSDPYTGDNKAQSEVREGGVVKGSYSLSEPDGTVRVVDYAADPVSGFNAVVKRVGPAVHPPQVIAKPIAVAPIAVSSYGLGKGLGYAGLGLGGLSYAGLGYGGLGYGGLGYAGLGYGGLGYGGLGYGGLGYAGIGYGGYNLGYNKGYGGWH